MSPQEAVRAIESLRKGIPPEGFVKHFTVGRSAEIEELQRITTEGTATALLLNANYGAGKTHLLKLAREFALDAGYVVSWVTIDSRSGVRFNRMDQILSCVFRGLEVPSARGEPGVGSFFNFVLPRIEELKGSTSGGGFWSELTNSGKWDYSAELESPGLFVALRAWATGERGAQDLVENWLSNTSEFGKNQKKVLYSGLVEQLRSRFRDPRRSSQFFQDGVFAFFAQDYHQSWAALRDIHRLAIEAGLRGLVVLFDEFEDVISNLTRINYKEKAFWNLFEFEMGKRFTGMSLFAVTPEFVDKCKVILLEHGRWDYDYERFEALPSFRMSPLSMPELKELARKIRAAHGLGYNWDAQTRFDEESLHRLVWDVGADRVEDRARRTITAVVRTLDRIQDELM